MAELTGDGKGDRRLSSWKEIAQFFGKDERTVKRWEQRGLPVRRVPRDTRSSVFAYESELEGWLRGGTPKPEVAAPAPLPGRRNMPLLAAVVVTAVIVGAVSVAYVATREAPVRAAHVAPVEAEALYRQGVIAWNDRTAAGFEKAIADFDAAIAIDPDYAAAHAGLANVYNLISQYTVMAPDEAYGRAAEAADRALALDPELADGYAAKAFNLFYGAHAFASSAEMFEEALKRDPNAAQTLHWYALTSMHSGAFERPLELIEKALALNPDSRTIRANRALIAFHAGRAAEAIDLLTGLKQADPDYLGTPSYLATIYLAQGRFADFLVEYEEAARVANNDTQLRIAAAARRGLADGGDAPMLAAMFEAQRREHEAGNEPAFKVAVTAALLGNDAAALQYLTTAVDRGESDALSIRIEGAFRRLHGNESFAALVRQVGFEPPR